ncbi:MULTISPECIES: alanine--tRNA ligase [Prochlorococcus]|uniref:alanine--tRNA ligase n=1 Tax=Prochlorococcus TaxID=1218 RepID=UPI0005652AC0|nr:MULTISPECIES: alanine--tRNA ligase [Prochlorococcus]
MTVEGLMSDNNCRPRTGEEIRSAFLKFFAERGHQVLPSASLVPTDPTVLLTIAGMLPFKPVFLGHEKRPASRVVTSQKCIRTNDIENVGRTARHQTFFEMLGNFSFGDYFKKEAIQWAWELSTKVYGLDPRNIVISIFREDDETEGIWRDVVGVKPQRIIRMDEADNFWTSGPTGPCGPCSELYYDFAPELGDESIDLEDDTRFIEFYNLVFMQYNRDTSGNLTSLANCNIDTGMGLERMAQILQDVPNNYETDLIFPLLTHLANLLGVNYQTLDDKTKVSYKVIGDHIRACVQLISDGVVASNLGRGYILRRLLRRAVRHGRQIGIDKPFLLDIGNVAIHLMKSSYPQLLKRKDFILKEIDQEELRFLETLGRGEKLLDDILGRHPKQITGEQAFELYDTYGFPLELTEEIAKENSLQVDLKAFDEAMERQRQRGKAAATTIDLTVQEVIDKTVRSIKPTIFHGYHSLQEVGIVQALIVDDKLVEEVNQGDKIQIILDSTPFYGESGGQVGDKGIVYRETHDDCLIQVHNVIRNNDVFVHSGLVQNGTLKVGDLIHSSVDAINRRCAQINHTATHLLQAALKEVIDSDISQAGSLVSFNRLRFDFQCNTALKSTDLQQVEDLINLWISESHTLVVNEMNISQAKAAGAVAMFGEKYGKTVRVVDVPGISMELCGGTHVANTSEIGAFKIVSESGIASGIRRIEAVAGPAILNYLEERELVVKTLSDRFKVQPNKIVDRVNTLQEEVKVLAKSLLKAQEDIAFAKTSALLTNAISIKNSQYIVARLDGISADALEVAIKTLLSKLGDNSAIVLAGVPNSNEPNKVIFIAAFGKNVVSDGLNAGKFLAPIAKICGGGGGGRPNFAQAGGKDSKSLDQALDFAKEQFASTLS